MTIWLGGLPVKAMVVLAFLLGCLFLVNWKPGAPHFETLEEFKRFAVRNGLFVHSGGSQPEAVYFDNFFVADHPVGLADLPLTKTDCGLTPAWRGVIWVFTLTHDSVHVQRSFISGKRRQWGNLIVAGDEQLMDRLERLYVEMGP